jgi:ATP-dependent Clp protease ATP-binding subunit ClpB
METRIARALISGDVMDGATIRVKVVEGDLVVVFDNPLDVT